MPLETTEEGWADADPASPLHDELVGFLRANEEWAFHARELADEVLDTDWELAHRRERERRRVGEEEFRRRLAAGEYDGQYLEESGGKAVADSIQTQAVIAMLDALAREGVLSVRAVPAAASNIPHDDEEPVRYYSYAGGE